MAYRGSFQDAPPTEESKSLTTLTPFYDEDVLYSEEEITQRKGTKQMDMKSYLKQMHPQECEWDQRDDDAMCGCVIYLSCRSLSHLKQELDAL